MIYEIEFGVSKLLLDARLKDKPSSKEFRRDSRQKWKKSAPLDSRETLIATKY